MTNKIKNLETEIAGLKNAIAKGWAKDRESELKRMEDELNALLAADAPKFTQPITPTFVDAGTEDKPDNSEHLNALMAAKENVRKRLLPEFENQNIADFQLIASVAESFAEERVHTVAYEVPETLRDQFNNTNAYLSFKSITTNDLSSREVKIEQAKKNWATVCTNYTTTSTGKFRNTDANKALKIGSQIVTFANALKYEHNPDNLLGILLVKFKTDSLVGKTTTVDAWLDIDIDDARMQQKRWYAHHKDTILGSLSDMDAYKPARLSVEKFERYKLLLAIAQVWGEDHFKNILEVVNNLVLTSGKTENEKFAEALDKAITDAQTKFSTPLTQMPSDTLITLLKESGCAYSRQTLPTALKELGINADTERKQITFFGNAVQGYELKVLEEALAPFKKAA